MSIEQILKTCSRELRRCALSFLLIILGVFLATRNAPAATPVSSQNRCMGSMEMITALIAQPVELGNQVLVQPIGKNLSRIHSWQADGKCTENRTIARRNRKLK